jgi:molecular chaperone HscB
MPTCWSCQAATPEQGFLAHFCPACGKIQPLPAAADLFGFLGLPVQFVVDRTQLEARYHELSRKLHPDRFTLASARERRLSMAKTTDLNQAVRTLRDRIARAHYLLRREGRELKEERRADPAFLMEVMETRERIAELKAEGPSGKAELEHMTAEMQEADLAALAAVDSVFERYDRSVAGDERDLLLAELATLVDRHKYHEGILRELTA